MRSQAVVLAAAMTLAPLGARAADLVVWWEKGFYPQEDEAVHEIVAAFEQETGKQVERALFSEDELAGKLETAIKAGRPPDFTFGVLLQDYLGQWAGEDRLAHGVAPEVLVERRHGLVAVPRVLLQRLADDHRAGVIEPHDTRRGGAQRLRNTLLAATRQVAGAR